MPAVAVFVQPFSSMYSEFGREVLYIIEGTVLGASKTAKTILHTRGSGLCSIYLSNLLISYPTLPQLLHSVCQGGVLRGHPVFI